MHLTYVGFAGDNLDPETAGDFPFRSDISFTVEGGTGRFEHAAGQMTMDVIFSDPGADMGDPFTVPIEFPFEFSGYLDY